MSQRDATNGYIPTMRVCISIIRTTRLKYNLDIRILTFTPASDRLMLH